MASNITILLVPGAFTTPACYDRLIPHLHKAGYPTASAQLLSADAADPATCSAASDGSHVLNDHLLPLIHEGRDVLIFAHSFGATCLPRGNTNDLLMKSERAKKGKKGGVLGLVCMSFAFVPEGQSQFDYLGRSWPPFVKPDAPRPGLVTIDPVIEQLYNDTHPSMHTELEKGHIGTAISAFTTPVLPPLWQDPALDGHRVYIKTLQDNMFPPGAQDMFVQNCGVEWKVVEVDGAHCALVSRPEEVVGVIVQAAESCL